jgi:hypothetical protein
MNAIPKPYRQEVRVIVTLNIVVSEMPNESYSLVSVMDGERVVAEFPCYNSPEAEEIAVILTRKWIQENFTPA